MNNKRQYFLLITLSLLFIATGCSTTPLKPSNTASAQGALFKLNQCTLQNRDFHCQLTLKAEERDLKVAIMKRTKLIDDLGNEYVLTGGNVANIEINKGQFSNTVKELVAGNPVNATFIFHNVSIKASKTKRLIIGGRIQAPPHNQWKDFSITVSE